ncbi:YihA family ribosome biogenesis GTP-binding protein [Campylobacter sp. MIT 12-8780]|uniref:ribosome biogenesis GTP-binding protein YihA/YsxC n=1 Tax=unclassified Campylobacter TaxID=2593542 RepID=UPI00115DE31B|nr:ribosome biogenesis GTP-binding protein YihA/YsxC [Campylobacter sp. MIT 12-8780]NDJ27850.1 YihA family ribosome biogenesis GTP-binding protein [Campylobacter sp. MIT 19-121]TQR40594.1 YihA family ribosome biogenesis GTP-binding protein [Campylobacter sp. MIT 12-8780]
MIIGAKFISSLARYDENAPLACTQIAFLGRSNVGKSSLINALCHQKSLAKSSSTPGKTQLINLFEVIFKFNEEKHTFIFVDLPGFGYAKVSKDTKEQWHKSLDEFLRKQRQIKLFVHLVDARHTNLELDEGLQQYLQSFLQADQRILRVFTKADKLNQSQKAKLKQNFKDAFLVSSTAKQGLEELENELFRQSLGL